MTEAGQTSIAAARDSLAELFNGALGPIDRLPLLRAVLEQVGQPCAEALGAITDVPVRMTFEGIESTSVGDAFPSAAGGGAGAIGVLEATAWGQRVIVGVPQGVAFAVVEMMLGGDGSAPAYIADRPLTRIEQAVVGVLFSEVGKALASAFAPISNTEFVLETTSAEIDPEVFAATERVVAARFRLEAFERGGELLVAIPHAALSPLRKTLSQQPAKDTSRPDPRWTEQIQSQITRAHVSLYAILDERMGTLGELANLRVGEIMELAATPQSLVAVECNGDRLMWCHLGKQNDYYTLRVDAFVDREAELMEDILAA